MSLDTEIVRTSFLIPVIDGLIYLGKRGTEPYKGQWSAIGGKVEKTGGPVLHDSPLTIEKRGGSTRISIFDESAIADGRELWFNAAAREFWEEAFHGKPYPKPEDRVFTDVYKIGCVDDSYPEFPNKNYQGLFFLARVNRRDFSLSPRELCDFKPLEKLTCEDQIAQPTRFALTQIYYLCESGLIKGIRAPVYGDFNLDKQIPIGLLKFDRYRFTDMPGALVSMREQGIRF